MSRLFPVLLLLIFTMVALGAGPAFANEAVAQPDCSACNTDLDGDGDTDDADLEILKAAIGKTEADAGFDPACDCNADGAVGAPDLSCMLQAIAASQ